MQSIRCLGIIAVLFATGDASRARGSEEPASPPVSRFVDPAGDDWQTEIQADHAKHRLSELAESLIKHRSLTKETARTFFAPKCRIGSLWTEDLKELSIGDWQVRRSPATSPIRRDPAAAFDALLQPHRDGQGLRMEMKIVGVEGGEKGSFTTTVVFHSFSYTAQRRLQQNARWRVQWSDGGSPDRPMIAGMTVSEFAEISTPSAAFTDCTRAVITDDSTWSPILSNACDYWHGRIDAVGETNFMGHQGIAVGDVNGDGLDDLYIALGTGLPNKLLVQQPDGTVRDTAARAGVDWLDDTKGALIIDIDNDGDQDLVIAMGPSILFSLNDGEGRFTPAGAARASTNGAFYSLAAADYDRDGDLDIYGCRYVEVQYGVSVPIPFEDANNGPPNILLRNDGPKGFADVTLSSGIDQNNRRFSTAAAWADYDNDGDPDLYVSNDFGRNNLYRNDGGRFVDVAAQAGVEDQAAGMGVSWSDYDLDGDLDLYVSNMYSGAGNRIAYQDRFQEKAETTTLQGVRRHTQGNTLLINQGNGLFKAAEDHAGAGMGRWAWGAKFVDLNNDGWDDIVCPNGFLTGPRPDDL